MWFETEKVSQTAKQANHFVHTFNIFHIKLYNSYSVIQKKVFAQVKTSLCDCSL